MDTASQEKPAVDEPTSANLPADHTYQTKESPRKLKRKFDECRDALIEKDRQLRLEKAKNARLLKKVDHLSNIVHNLKEKGYISDGCAQILENSFSGIPRAVMQRILKKSEGEHAGAYS